MEELAPDISLVHDGIIGSHKQTLTMLGVRSAMPGKAQRAAASTSPAPEAAAGTKKSQEGRPKALKRAASKRDTQVVVKRSSNATGTRRSSAAVDTAAPISRKRSSVSARITGRQASATAQLRRSPQPPSTELPGITADSAPPGDPFKPKSLASSRSPARRVSVSTAPAGRSKDDPPLRGSSRRR
jgi:hypothetical protein